MKKILASSLALLAVLSAQATGTVSLQGVNYQVDTLFYAQVGPGTMQTSLLLTSGTKHLRVFYTTTDVTAPWVQIKAVSGTDRMTGGETVSQMAKRKTAPGARYFAGVNGDFWFTGGTTKRGQSMVGTPIATCIADGTIFRALNNAEYQFTLNAAGQPSLGQVTFGGQVVKTDGTSAPIYGVNVDAASNYITLYNPTYYTGTNQTSTCSEVTVQLVDGDASLAWGKPCRLVVAGAPSTAGDMDVPTTGLVLHGQGSTHDFINSLRQGDSLTLTLTATMAGQSIAPSEIISGQPWVLNAGVTQHGDGSVHPRTVLGYDKTGTKVFMMVVDGRSTLSDGATTDALGDLMRYAGAWMAVNVDGGGSSCLYTSALGVRNRPSDGTERADANGIFSVSTAPDCDTISSIRFLDWSLNLPQYATYTPKFFGYNKYGMLVDTDVQGVKLSCPPELGVIKGDTTLYATGLGTYNLTAVYGTDTITLPCTVTASSSGISLKHAAVINDSYRRYQVELQGTVLDKTIAIDPAALSWRSTDEAVVTVDSTGTLQGLKDGTAWVIGSKGDITDSLQVTVQVPTAHLMPIALYNADSLNITQLGGSERTVTPDGAGGFTLSYTGASARAARVVLTKQVTLWSIPDGVQFSLNPGQATIKTVTFGIRANGGNMVYHTVTPDSVPKGDVTTISLPTADWTNATDVGSYPITLESIQLNMGSNKKGQKYNMHFLGFQTVYNALPASLTGDVDGNGTINVDDVTALVNQILNLTPKTAAADVDANGTINVDDVTALITLILDSK